MFQIGFQNTPVDSIAAASTPSAINQSDSLSNSPVIVPKVRTSRVTRPAESTRRTHAATVSLCTSNPAQQRYIVSIASLPGRSRRRWTSKVQAVCSACSANVAGNNLWFEAMPWPD